MPRVSPELSTQWRTVSTAEDTMAHHRDFMVNVIAPGLYAASQHGTQTSYGCALRTS